MPLDYVPKPLVVVILDGWGISAEKRGNAVAAADTPTMNMLARHYPSASLQAAGVEVGLPWGEMGNSETGHTNIGAGRVAYQTLPYIDNEIHNGEFFKNKELLSAIEHAKQYESKLHLMGCLSTGGIHSHINHLFALLDMVKKNGLRDKVFVHVFTDGRDVPQQSAVGFIAQLEERMAKLGIGKIASVTGRMYAMDRNQSWDRTKMTYDLLTGTSWEKGAASAKEAVESSYSAGIFDEKILPTVVTRGGELIAKIEENDAVIFFNFRPDRARQITRAFAQADFMSFDRKSIPGNVRFVTMTRYDPDIPAPAAYLEHTVDYPIARILSEASFKQLHIAETEKYAHITYYLNGGYEKPFPNEKHVLIRSSQVKDFAEEPRMKAGEITNALLAELSQTDYDIAFVNFANADMVGHTGNYVAAVEACTFVDQCLRRVYEAVVPSGGALLVTADHGNAEEMINLQSNELTTDHTANPVPIHFVYDRLKRTTPRSDNELQDLFANPIGMLADVAPTILDIMQVPQPQSMTGISLLDSLQ